MGIEDGLDYNWFQASDLPPHIEEQFADWLELSRHQTSPNFNHYSSRFNRDSANEFDKDTLERFAKRSRALVVNSDSNPIFLIFAQRLTDEILGYNYNLYFGGCFNTGVTAIPSSFWSGVRRSMRPHSGDRSYLICCNPNFIDGLVGRMYARLSRIDVRKFCIGSPLLMPVLPKGVSIRSARQSDEGFLLNCISTAIKIGVDDGNAMQSNDWDERRQAKNFLSNIAGEDAMVLVAQKDENLIGCAYATVDWMHFFRGVLEARIWDSFTVNEWRGNGIAKALTSILLHLASQRGMTHINGTISGGSAEHINSIRDALSSDGWRPEICWYCLV